MSDASVKTLTESVNIALNQEYDQEVCEGVMDIYSWTPVDSDDVAREVRVAVWDRNSALLDEPVKRFRIRVEEVTG